MANDSIANARKQLQLRLGQNLPAGIDVDRVKWENSASFKTPANEPWLRVTTRILGRDNIQAGGSWRRTGGIYIIDLFHPLATIGSNRDDIDQILESIIGTYENTRFNDVNCEEATPKHIGVDGSWYHTQVDISFYYEGA